VDDDAFFSVAFGSGDAPVLRSGVNEQDPRHCAHFAEAFPLGGRGGAAAGHLNAENGVVVSRIHGRGLDFYS